MAESPQTKGQQTRRAIMDAAREIILDSGYTAASMRKIAEVAGITPAAIYNHFASKEDLFSSLLQEAAPVQEITDFLGMVKADSAEDLMEAAFRGLIDLSEQHEEYIRLALIDAQERDGATLVTMVPRMFPPLMKLAGRLQELDDGIGLLRPLSPIVIARFLVSLIVGYSLTERIGRPQQTLNLPPLDWESELLDVFMFGIFRNKQTAGSRSRS